MKDKNKVSFSMIFLVFLIFAIVMVFVTIMLSNRIIDTSNYFKSPNTTIKNNLSEQLEYQKKMDIKIKDIATNGNYSLNQPYVLVNPYRISPLSAIIIFNTLNKESVEVYINDELVTTNHAAIQHIIPIIGLNTNTNNIIRLVSSSGEETSLEVTTDIFNDYIQEFKVSDILDNQKSLLVLGDINDFSSTLRGFNKNNSLNLHISFDYMSGIKIDENHILLNYNTRNYNNKLQGLKLEIDYLGRIYSISTNTDDLSYNPNLSLESENYITLSTNYYNKSIFSYSYASVSDSTPYTEYKSIATETITTELNNAVAYDKKFDISLMGEYISVNFEESKLNLLLVNQYNNYTYAYSIKGSELIKVKRTDKVSLYVEKDGKYYSLLTILES